jgi:hypothetical protein
MEKWEFSGTGIKKKRGQQELTICNYNKCPSGNGNVPDGAVSHQL